MGLSGEFVSLATETILPIEMGYATKSLTIILSQHRPISCHSPSTGKSRRMHGIENNRALRSQIGWSIVEVEHGNRRIEEDRGESVACCPALI